MNEHMVILPVWLICLSPGPLYLPNSFTSFRLSAANHQLACRHRHTHTRVCAHTYIHRVASLPSPTIIGSIGPYHRI